MKPTIYLTNAASRRPPQRGPGRVWTIMAAPRGHLGERGEGEIFDLVPPLHWVQQAKANVAAVEQYRAAYSGLMDVRVSLGRLQPGRLVASQTSPNGDKKIPVGDGDTLICCCSRAQAAQGRCHRSWAAEALKRAGWRVVLDGKGLES